MHSNNRKRCHPLNTALRLITFLARNLIAIAVVIILIVLATFISYDMANIYVMINDGLSERANVIIHHEDPSDLSRFFTMSYLFSDPAFQSDQYKDYIVSDYDYDLKIKHMWVWHLGVKHCGDSGRGLSMMNPGSSTLPMNFVRG